MYEALQIAVANAEYVVVQLMRCIVGAAATRNVDGPSHRNLQILAQNMIPRAETLCFSPRFGRLRIGFGWQMGRDSLNRRVLPWIMERPGR